MPLMAFFPSLLWVYFLMAPGGLADKTTCLPHPFRALNLPTQVFHPCLPTFPFTDISQPHLPPAPLGHCLFLIVSFTFSQIQFYQANSNSSSLRTLYGRPIQPAAATGDATPLQIPQHWILPHCVFTSGLGTSVRLEAPGGQEPWCVCYRTGLTGCLVHSRDCLCISYINPGRKDYSLHRERFNCARTVPFRMSRIWTECQVIALGQCKVALNSGNTQI